MWMMCKTNEQIEDLETLDLSDVKGVQFDQELNARGDYPELIEWLQLRWPNVQFAQIIKTWDSK